MIVNIARVHQTPGVTAMMEAGVADHVRLIDGIVRLIGPAERRPRTECDGIPTRHTT
jgi:hypothetical protein